MDKLLATLNSLCDDNGEDGVVPVRALRHVLQLFEAQQIWEYAARDDKYEHPFYVAGQFSTAYENYVFASDYVGKNPGSVLCRRIVLDGSPVTSWGPV